MKILILLLLASCSTIPKKELFLYKHTVYAHYVSYKPFTGFLCQAEWKENKEYHCLEVER